MTFTTRLRITPEIVADVGIRQGEKCDYAIISGGKPIILFECKATNANLSRINPTQLYRYFSVTPARFGILTNGIHYQVFSDFDEPNRMDSKPFLELDMLNLEAVVVEQFRQFTKPIFNLETVLTSSLEFKYTREIKRILTAQVREPSRELVRLLSDEIHKGRMTDNAYARFSEFVKHAWHQLLNDLITERLKAAMIPPGTKSQEKTSTPDERKVITTAEELEAYYVTKAIVRETTDPKRISIRDALSYCAILFDDNNRKPICRLYFNGAQKYVGFFGVDKREQRAPIDTIDDIYKHADRLKAVVAAYMAGTLTIEAPEVQPSQPTA